MERAAQHGLTSLQVPFRGGKTWVGIYGNERPGVPLLCVAGGPGMPHDYLDTLASLADERPVVFYDQIGCGRSSRLDLPWSRELLLEELGVVRAALGDAPMHLLLHSAASLFGVDELLRHPNAYAAAILASAPVDIPALTIEVEHHIDLLGPERAAVLRDGEANPRRRGTEYSRCYSEYVQRFSMRLHTTPLGLQRARAGFNPASLMAVKGGLLLHRGPVRTWSIAARLPELAMPILATCGRHDAVTPTMIGAVAASVPRGRAIVFEQSSHMAHLEEDEAYLAAIRTFLRDVDAAVPP